MTKYLQYPLKELIKLKSSISVLLDKYQIDTAANANQPLISVLQHMDIDADTLGGAVELLIQQPDSDAKWLLSPATELIKHIETHYHKTHREKLPQLIELARKIQAQQAVSEFFPTGLVSLLEDLQEDLFAHMDSEEKFIFPALAANKAQHIYCQVGMIMHNHDHHLYVLERLKAMTDNFRAPQHASTEWIALYKGIAQFKKDLIEHIRLENELLFSQSV